MTAAARLAEIQARADAATEGPWHPEFGMHGDPFVITDPSRPAFTRVAGISTAPDDYGRATAEFIAAARQDVPALVAMGLAVLELHRQEYGACVHCTGLYSVSWPCETVRAVESALGGAR